MAEKKKKKITVQASNRKITYDVKENGKADTGRPDKMDDDTIAKLEEAFRADGTIAEACANAEIDESTFHRWFNKNANFRKKMRIAKNYPTLFAKKTLFNSISSDKEEIAQRGAIEFLKRREPRYKDKVENTVDMDLDANIDEKIDLKSESMIELEERRKGLLGFK